MEVFHKVHMAHVLANAQLDIVESIVELQMLVFMVQMGNPVFMVMSLDLLVVVAVYVTWDTQVSIVIHQTLVLSQTMGRHVSMELFKEQLEIAFAHVMQAIVVSIARFMILVSTVHMDSFVRMVVSLLELQELVAANAKMVSLEIIARRL